jgi:hypothetical protein
VETGTARSRNDFAGAGMATLTLGHFCKRYGKPLWTVDIRPEAIAISKRVTAKLQDVITYVTGDSVEFLAAFPEQIDLLYLDSMDCPPHDSDPEGLRSSQNHQLHELQAAWDKLHDRTIILLDDNDFANGGKTVLTNQFLDEQGWTCLMADKQALWVWDGCSGASDYCPA